MADLTGTDENDTLAGTTGDDLIEGLGGDDEIDGKEGTDTLRGGEGDDYIVGGAGDDSIEGGNGRDNLNGGFGDDLIEAGEGDDYVASYDGSDTIHLGSGLNSLFVSRGLGAIGHVVVTGGDQRDSVSLTSFGTGDFDMSLGGGDDVLELTMLKSHSVVDLGAGADRIRMWEFGAGIIGFGSLAIAGFTPGAGGDRLDWNGFLAAGLTGWNHALNPFGTGHVRLRQEGNDAVLEIDSNGGGNGYVTLFTFKNADSSLFIDENFDGYRPDGSASVALDLTGTESAETFDGSGAGDRIDGAAGDDTIEGGGGNDTLVGGSGRDTLRGEIGDDILQGGADDDDLNGGYGVDTLHGGEGRDYFLDDRGTDTFYGDGGSDTLVFNTTVSGGLMRAFGGEGDDSVNILAYHGGSYIVDGGPGSDRIYISALRTTADITLGADSDTLRLEAFNANYLATMGSIVVRDFETGAEGDKLDFATFLSAALTGWDGAANPFAANLGFVRLLQSNSDTLLQIDTNGGGNSYRTIVTFKNLAPAAFTAENFGGFPPNGSAVPPKTITGTELDDTLHGDSGDDLIEGLGGDDWLYGDSGSDELRGGIGDDILYGETGNDRLIGEDGGDSFQGGLGDDIMEGGDGDDVFFDESGSDQIFGGAGEDHVTIQRSTIATETILVDAGEDDDRLILHTYVSGTSIQVDAGSGSDSISIMAMDGAATLTLGSGADSISFGEPYAQDHGGSVRVQDFVGGAGGDRVDFIAFLTEAAPAWDGNSNPFDTGFARIVQSGSDTLLQFDMDAAAGIHSFFTALTFANVNAYALTADNIGHTFATLYGSAGNDTVVGDGRSNHVLGGSGNDSIDGAGGDDNLDGGSGNDSIDGGAGDDRLAAGSGDDSYAGGEGIDTLDYSGEPGPVAVNLHSALFIYPAGHPYAARSLGPGEALDSFGNYETVSGIENLVLTAGNDNALGSDVANRIEGGSGSDQILGMGGNDVVLGGAGDDEIGGGDGDDDLQGGADHDGIFGDSGSDSIDGGSGDDVVLGGTGGDTIQGGDGDDVVRGEDGDDLLSGGNGSDLLRGGSGVDSFDGGANEGGADPADGFGDRVSFFETRATQGVVADLRTGTISNDGFGNAETMTGIESLGADTAYADTFYGNDNRNALLVGRGDSAYGFGGDDLIEAGGAPATVDGGDGTDLLRLRSEPGFLLPDNNGDGNAELSTWMPSGWKVDLAAGTLRDGFGAVGTVAGIENVNGADLGDEIRGTAGANRFEGGGGNDFLLLQDGGDDIALGGAGNDVVYFGTALSAGDVADGGEGRDAIVLQGNVTAVLSETNLVGIESISIQSGANSFFGDTANNFYDYSVTTANGNVAAGEQLIVNAQSLRIGEDFTFDGSAEKDGKFVVYGGHGTDDLTGGDGADVFFFEGQRWGPSDKVDGGAGRDSVAISAGNGLNRIEFGADSLTRIESISVNNFFATDPSQKPSYELVLHNGNVAAGSTLIVNGSSIPLGQVVNIDGRGVHDGNLILLGGGGHDVIIGGDGADTILGGGGQDSLAGGAGGDTFRYDSVSDSPAGANDLIADFQPYGIDRIDLSRIDSNTHADGDQAFTFIGVSAFSGTGATSAGQLRFRDEGGYRWVDGDVNGDGHADFSIAFHPNSAPQVQADFLL